MHANIHRGAGSREGRGKAGRGVFALARQGDWIKWQLKQEQCEVSEEGCGGWEGDN